MRCLAAAQAWPGGTLWELLYTGCVVLSYTRNPLQASVTKTLAKRNILADLGNVPGFQGPALIATLQELRASASKRKSMAEAGRRLIDGKGAQRVVQKFDQFDCPVMLSPCEAYATGNEEWRIFCRK